jgi:predicted house-cleaning noncanonical NTP pyrophosphatase (MazG superfamily)
MKNYPKENVYNKLVRDNIPQIIEEDGVSAEVKILSKQELIFNLKEKLIEEAGELKEASEKADQAREVADCLEVIYTLCEELKIDLREVEKERIRRKEKRGGFKKGIFLIKTTVNKEEKNA